MLKFFKRIAYFIPRWSEDQKNKGYLIFNFFLKKEVFNFFVNRNWKKLTDSRKRAKILADNRKGHHPIETLWVRVRTNLLYFLYITSEVKQYYRALFLSQQYFTVFQDKLHSFNIQDYRSTRGHLAKPIQKIFKITYTASRFSLLTSAKFAADINRVTLQHHK